MNNDKYYVVLACSNSKCSNINHKHIVDALSFDIADEIAYDLRENKPLKCPICQKKMEYYAQIK